MRLPCRARPRPSSNPTAAISASTDAPAAPADRPLAVVVLAALADPPDPALDPRIREAVAEHAVRWATELAAPGLVSTVDPPADEIVTALSRLLEDHDGPVVLVAPDVPRLDEALARDVRDDLAAGCAVSFAPATDGRPFLLAFAQASPEALALLAAEDRSRDAIFTQTLALGEVGMLRSERRVVTPEDARALAIDPMVDAGLRALAGRQG